MKHHRNTGWSAVYDIQIRLGLIFTVIAIAAVVLKF